MMLQHDVPDDYVIGTGQLRTVRDLCAMAYGYVGKSWEPYVETDPRFVRPADTGPTVADASKARLELGWQPTISFEDMIAEMVDAHVLRLSGSFSEGRL
jgi:GDPmannose 4,6-dehydratase